MGPRDAAEAKLGRKPGVPGTQTPLQLAFCQSTRTVDLCACVCKAAGKDAHAPNSKFQFSLWVLDVNLLGLKSRR